MFGCFFCCLFSFVPTTLVLALGSDRDGGIVKRDNKWWQALFAADCGLAGDSVAVGAS
jgi:hypothetical protein